ncbi:MAG: hypothetical protein OXB84_00575 [Halobacteriovoraceae bacterium]|nr:hypothetical protein [Halobacteriovoraceae bacterium]
MKEMRSGKYSMWPPIYYFENIATKLQENNSLEEFDIDLAKDILETLKDSISLLANNAAMVFNLFFCILKLPASILKKEDIQFIFKIFREKDHWKDSLSFSIGVLNSFKIILTSLEINKYSNSSRDIFKIYLMELFAVESYSSESSCKKFLFFHSQSDIGFTYREFLKALQKGDITILKEDAIDVFQYLLTESIRRIPRIDRLSTFWRPTVEDNSMNDIITYAQSVYVMFIYNITSNALEKNVKMSEKISSWKDLNIIIFLRIYINLVARVMDEEKNECAKKIISLEMKEWRSCRYEIFLFFKEKFDLLKKAQQDGILDRIESIQESNDVITQNEKNRWLQAMKNSRYDRATKLYKKTIEVIGNDSDYTQFNYKISSYEGEKAPCNIDELMKKNPEEIYKLLLNFKETGYPDTPSKKGLGNVLEECIFNKPEICLFLLNDKLPRVYLCSIVKGFSRAWNNKKIINYEKFLIQIKSLLDNQKIKREISEDEYMVMDAILVLLRFIQSGVAEDGYAFDEKVNNNCYEILIRLSYLIKPSDKYGIEGQDSCTRAINEPRGVLFETAIFLALRQARICKQKRKSWKKVWKQLENLIKEPLIQQSINEISLYSLIGSYYLQIDFLNKDWIYKYFQLIAPIGQRDKECLWIAFMEGICWSNTYNLKMYKKLKTEGLLLSFFRSEQEVSIRKKSRSYSCRVVDLCLIAYLDDYEDFKSSIIKKIIDDERPDEWRVVISSMFKFVENASPEKINKIKYILNAFIIKYENLPQDKTGEYFYGLTRFLTIFNPQCELVKKMINILSKVNDDSLFTMDSIVNYLHENRSQYFEVVGKLLSSFLEASSKFSGYSLDKILDICQILKSKKQKTHLGIILRSFEKFIPHHQRTEELKNIYHECST